MTGSKWAWEVPEGVAPTRADQMIHLAIETGAGNWEGEPLPCSRSRLQKLMDDGQVTADGRAVKPNLRFKGGEKIEIVFPAPKPLEAKPEDRPLDILYQDEHLLVVNKPPGLTVHPSETQVDGTLVNILLHHIKDLSGIGGALRPGIVHRIDKNTSGALVITKTDLAHQRLVETFSKHDIERAYWALCYGAPPGPCGDLSKPTKIEGAIGRHPTDRKKMAILKAGGRHAVSYYRKLEEYRGSGRAPFASWLEVTLETGRTHQVRVHLTSLGYSLLGDPAYGTPTSNQPKWQALPAPVREAVARLPGQALHARVLGFKHPITGVPLRFEAEPPAEFQVLLEALKGYRA